MMRVVGICLLLLLLAVVHNIHAEGFEDPPLEAINKALKYTDKAYFNHNGGEIALSAGWLKADEDLNNIQIKLGRGYPRYTIDIDRMMASKDSSMLDCLEFVAWCFPIYFDGEYRLSIEIKQNGNEYRLYQIGFVPAAPAIIEARESMKQEEGYSHAHVQILGGPSIVVAKVKGVLLAKVLNEWAKKELFGKDRANADAYINADEIFKKMRDADLMNRGIRIE